jgi:hypothetical protein
MDTVTDHQLKVEKEAGPPKEMARRMEKVNCFERANIKKDRRGLKGVIIADCDKTLINQMNTWVSMAHSRKRGCGIPIK